MYIKIDYDTIFALISCLYPVKKDKSKPRGTGGKVGEPGVKHYWR